MTKYSKYNLSNRQSDVLDCLIEGWTTKKIASTLYITDRTVQTHLKAIYKKLQVKTRTEAASLILRDSKITITAIEIPPVPANYSNVSNIFDVVLSNILAYRLKNLDTNHCSAEYHLAMSAFVARNNSSENFISSLPLDMVEELNYMCNLIKFI